MSCLGREDETSGKEGGKLEQKNRTKRNPVQIFKCGGRRESEKSDEKRPKKKKKDTHDLIVITVFHSLRRRGGYYILESMHQSTRLGNP